MNPIECPVAEQDLLYAMFEGRFRRMRLSEEKMLGIEYTGYIWQRLNDSIYVVCEHTPGGLNFKVSNGEQVWTTSIENPIFQQVG